MQHHRVEREGAIHDHQDLQFVRATAVALVQLARNLVDSTLDQAIRYKQLFEQMQGVLR